MLALPAVILIAVNTIQLKFGLWNNAGGLKVHRQLADREMLLVSKVSVNKLRMAPTKELSKTGGAFDKTLRFS